MKNKKRFGFPHIQYYRFPERVQAAKKRYFELLDDEWFDNKKIFSTIKTEFNIPRTTMERWTQRWKIDINYDPCDTSVHGTFNRIFSDQQENDNTDYIDRNIIQPGKYFPDFETLIYDAYDEVYPDPEDAPRFECSPTFILVFKKR